MLVTASGTPMWSHFGADASNECCRNAVGGTRRSGDFVDLVDCWAPAVRPPGSEWYCCAGDVSSRAAADPQKARLMAPVSMSVRLCASDAGGPPEAEWRWRRPWSWIRPGETQPVLVVLSGTRAMLWSAVLGKTPSGFSPNAFQNRHQRVPRSFNAEPCPGPPPRRTNPLGVGCSPKLKSAQRSDQQFWYGRVPEIGKSRSTAF